MAKTPGTASSTGLLHLPALPTPAGVEYQQIGGFGPVSRDVALAAARRAGAVGNTKPSKIWVQRPKHPDAVLTQVMAMLDAQKVRFSTITKDDDAKAGFGVYYQYGDKVVMEHTSDPESKVNINGIATLLPHVHVEVVDYVELSKAHIAVNDRIKAINAFKIFDDTTNPPSANRLVRVGQSDPTSKEKKPKFNHHIYYRL